MNPREAGFLLLTCSLGNPERKVLTTAQLRTLAERMKAMEIPQEERELTVKDIQNLGYSREMGERILSLLEDGQLLRRYCSRGKELLCLPLTRVSPAYPALLRRRLGQDAPGCLWAKGNPALLQRPAVALVGSREIHGQNLAFAEAVGRIAAENGFVLVSGNARGADKAAQNACLEAGGSVISIVADELYRQPEGENVLYLSEDGFDEAFSAQRALSRNRCIHALGRTVFVARCASGKGGTWDGTVKNLRHGWSSVACFRDGSEASRQLEQLGAYLVGEEEIRDFFFRPEEQTTFLGV